jgi:hypothetical protein
MRALALLLAAGVSLGSTCLADESAIFLPTFLAARVESGERSGLSIALEVRPGGALVSVNEPVSALPGTPAWPLVGKARCGDPMALQVPASFVLPSEFSEMEARTDSALELTTRVVEVVSDLITLDENDQGPQDAVSVLTRRRGRCSGRANLAVGLLRRVGIPARVVRGILVGDAGARWHRWGEAWLGPLGWISFDPGAAVGLVGVRYLPLQGAGEGASLSGVRLERINESGYVALPVRSGMRVLPVGGVTVRCLAPAKDRVVTALLVGPDGSRWARRGRGEVVFFGMLPGRYRILWRGEGHLNVLDVRLEGQREVRLDLADGTGAGS